MHSDEGGEIEASNLLSLVPMYFSLLGGTLMSWFIFMGVFGVIYLILYTAIPDFISLTFAEISEICLAGVFVSKVIRMSHGN